MSVASDIKHLNAQNASLMEENARLKRRLGEAMRLLIESQDNIGGDWRERRDEFVTKGAK